MRLVENEANLSFGFFAAFDSLWSRYSYRIAARYIVGKGVLIAATGLLNPDLFMANSTSELNSAINTASTVKLPMLFASIAVILLFALLAAFPAARYASHVSPTVAMSGQTVKIKRRIKGTATSVILKPIMQGST